jgi:hypothetical protein
MIEFLITLVNSPIISTFIAILAFQFYYFKKDKQINIYKQHLEIYLEISRMIVDTKLNFEEKIGGLVKDIENDNIDEQKYQQIEDELRDISMHLYKNIYSYAFLLPNEIFIKLEQIYKDISVYIAFNPSKNIVDNKNQKELTSKFNEVLKLLSEKIEVRNKLRISLQVKGRISLNENS